MSRAKQTPDLESALYVWKELSVIPLSIEEDCEDDIDTDFKVYLPNYGCLYWSKGTNRFEIWQDIEHLFAVSVGDDLMGTEDEYNKKRKGVIL